MVFCCVIATLDIEAKCGDVRPLDEAQLRRLKVNRVHLLDLIDPNHAFVTELASPVVGCIRWSQRQHIIDIVSSRDRNEKLIDFLTRRSVDHFTKFTRVLAKQQKHLVQLLVTDKGETFSCATKNFIRQPLAAEVYYLTATCLSFCLFSH